MLPVNFSDKAIQEIQHTFSHKNIPDSYGLRVGVQGGGCAGVSYIIGFDQKTAQDVEYQVENFPVFIAKKDVMFLFGMRIDFYEGNEARGFVFINPVQQKASS